jgi:hypothetical protein
MQKIPHFHTFFNVNTKAPGVALHKESQGVEEWRTGS